MNNSSDSSQNHPTAPSPEPADQLPEAAEQAAPLEPGPDVPQAEPIQPQAEPVVHSTAEDIYGQHPSSEPSQTEIPTAESPQPEAPQSETSQPETPLAQPPLPDHLLPEAERQEPMEPVVAAAPIEPAHHVGVPDIEDDAELSQARARRFGAERFEEPADSQATRVLPAAEINPAATDSVTSTEPATTPLPTSAQAAAVPAGGAAGAVAASSAGQTTTARTARADLFAGLEDMPASRAAAHWWVILATLLFTPVAWFLISDGGERFAHTLNTAGAVSVPALVQLVGGFVALFIVLLAARWSSVGPIIIGSVSAIAGATFFAIPDLTVQTLAEYQHIFARLGQFGQTAYEQLLLDGTSGRLFAYGLVLLMAGVISHGARRQGRREERRRIALEL